MKSAAAYGGGIGALVHLSTCFTVYIIDAEIEGDKRHDTGQPWWSKKDATIKLSIKSY